MSDRDHLNVEIERCRKFVTMLSGGNRSGGETGTRERFVARLAALERVRDVYDKAIAS